MIITLGEEGALVYDGATAVHFEAFPIEVIDTTGAGDAFNGALAVGLSAGGSLEQVIPLVQLGIDDSPRRNDLTEGLSHEQALIEIPADINDVEQKSGEIASQWREATRSAFAEAFAAGYLVKGFYRGNRGDQMVGRYLLKRGENIDDIN